MPVATSRLMYQHIIVSVARIAYALPAEGEGLQWMASIESFIIYGPDISKNVTIINLFYISCSSVMFIHSFLNIELLTRRSSRPLMEWTETPSVQCSWPFWGTRTSKSATISIMNVWWKCWSIVFYKNILRRKICCDPYERNSLRWNEYGWNRRGDNARVAIKWKCFRIDACDFRCQTHARESLVAWWCSNIYLYYRYHTRLLFRLKKPPYPPTVQQP